MTTPTVDTDRVRSPTRTRVAWLLGGSGLLLAVLLTGMVLWWMMPSWFRRAVIAYAPGADLAYGAAEADGGDGGLEYGLFQRFPAEALLEQTAERLGRGTVDERRYAARCIGWIFRQRSTPAETILDDPALRQRLVDGLAAISHGAEPGCIDTACAALLEMGEVHRLPEILRILDDQRGSRWYSLYALRKHTADPLVTTHLLTWFHARPHGETMKALLKQDDPRVEDLIVSVMRTPSYGTALRRQGLSYAGPASPAYLAAVRSLCAEQEDVLYSDALYTLAGADDPIGWMLDVRLDPTAAPAHREAEEYLKEHAADLSIDQAYRWIAAPPLPAGSGR